MARKSREPNEHGFQTGPMRRPTGRFRAFSRASNAGDLAAWLAISRPKNPGDVLCILAGKLAARIASGKDANAAPAEG